MPVQTDVKKKREPTIVKKKKNFQKYPDVCDHCYINRYNGTTVSV
jgi:hypothetical protein